MPRKPKPIAQHILEGTYRHGRHGILAGTFDTLKHPEPCPDSITTERARDAWNQIIPRLTSSGRLATEDLPGLEMAFRAFQLSSTLMDELVKLDVVKDASKIRMLSSVANQNASLFLNTLTQFGFSSKGREAILQTLAAQKTATKKSLADRMTE